MDYFPVMQVTEYRFIRLRISIQSRRLCFHNEKYQHGNRYRIETDCLCIETRKILMRKDDRIPKIYNERLIPIQNQKVQTVVLSFNIFLDYHRGLSSNRKFLNR